MAFWSSRLKSSDLLLKGITETNLDLSPEPNTPNGAQMVSWCSRLKSCDLLIKGINETTTDPSAERGTLN